MERHTSFARIVEDFFRLPHDADGSDSGSPPASPRSGTGTGDAGHLGSPPPPQAPGEAAAADAGAPPEREGGGRWSLDFLGGVPVLGALLGSPTAAAAAAKQAGPEGAAPAAPPLHPPGGGGGGDESGSDGDEPAGDTRPGEPLPAPPAGAPPPALSEPSALLSGAEAAALAAAAPRRFRDARWRLLYSSRRDGISLATLLRSARGHAPTLLVVRDMDRATFGAYAPEAWRPSRHFYGTGEAFVFALRPGPPALWRWWAKKMAKPGAPRNDLFQWASAAELAAGGAGGYALRLDADLAAGVSRPCATFGSACLAGREEFRVGAVELWWLS